MTGMRMWPSFSRLHREAKTSDSGTKRAGSQPAQPPSKPGGQPSGPALKRSESLPARLPSHPFEPAEVKPARPPISRPLPDTKPPVSFLKPQGTETRESLFEKKSRRIFNIPIPFTQRMSKRTWDACVEKSNAMSANSSKLFEHLEYMPENKEYVDILKERHPDIASYSPQEIKKHSYNLLNKHPKFEAETAKSLNELYSIPSRATGSRMMKPGEQRFLTAAFKRLGEEFKNNPLRIHGEMGISGTKKGRISEPEYSSTQDVIIITKTDDNYVLHTHPPYHEPLTSSASREDHIQAAEAYYRLFHKRGCYVTNGKDVMHISPTSTELTRLIPDPKLEKKLGQFPAAFTLPEPQRPSHPFANHEAPGGFGPWDRRR
jgi:hypothetical protein